MEFERKNHRLGEADAVLEGQVAEVLSDDSVSDGDKDESNRVIYMDFGGDK
ncbi:hypothetical protein [Bartonella massiliensis]|uniref:hypothetical protein n=1 Tax=Bartonella massiliensis TaxID=929795 RepID=UPI00163CBCF2|nr:hypothetical protein [Bartonella massiliensis]